MNDMYKLSLDRDVEKKCDIEKILVTRLRSNDSTVMIKSFDFYLI